MQSIGGWFAGMQGVWSVTARQTTRLGFLPRMLRDPVVLREGVSRAWRQPSIASIACSGRQAGMEVAKPLRF